MKIVFKGTLRLTQKNEYVRNEQSQVLEDLNKIYLKPIKETKDYSNNEGFP